MSERAGPSIVIAERFLGLLMFIVGTILAYHTQANLRDFAAEMGREAAAYAQILTAFGLLLALIGVLLLFAKVK